MNKLLEIAGKVLTVIGVTALAMDREKAIAEFPEAVEAGDDAAAENAIARAALADSTLRKSGYTPPQ